MREIKFRGFADNEMIYDINHLQIVHGTVFVSFPLMQFTGQYDIHDKEIYEGDIVKTQAIDLLLREFKMVFTVEYSHEISGFVYLNIDGTRYGNILVCCGDVMPEIIGNIYENPELLEEKV